MNPTLQKIFDRVPDDEPRSRLEPYRELILRWRRQGRTYRRIRELLAEQCNVKVTTAMLHKFVQSRSRPRKVEPETALRPVTPVPTAAAPAPSSEQRPRTYTKLSPEEADAQREFVRALARKPVVGPAEDTRERFVYDPSKPLTNKPTKE